MKQIFCIFLCMWLLIPFLSISQEDKHFSNVLGFDRKVDSLPYFAFNISELDTFLVNNQIFRSVEEEWGVNLYVYVSFYVDTVGKPNNIIISKIEGNVNKQTKLKNGYYSDTLKKYYAKESARLIMLTEGLWVSNHINTKRQLNIIIPYETQAYDAKNTASLKPERMPSSIIDYVNPPNQGEVTTLKKIYSYYDYGVSKLSQNKPLIAEKYFLQALKIKKDDIDALYNLGLCYMKLHDNSNACKAWIEGQRYGDKEVGALIAKYCK